MTFCYERTMDWLFARSRDDFSGIPLCYHRDHLMGAWARPSRLRCDSSWIIVRPTIPRRMGLCSEGEVAGRRKWAGWMTHKLWLFSLRGRLLIENVRLSVENIIWFLTALVVAHIDFNLDDPVAKLSLLSSIRHEQKSNSHVKEMSLLSLL